RTTASCRRRGQGALIQITIRWRKAVYQRFPLRSGCASLPHPQEAAPRAPGRAKYQRGETMIRIALNARLRASLLAAASIAVLAEPALAQTQPQEARVMQILKRTPLIDGHNDLPWALRQGFGNDPQGVELNANLSSSTRLHTDI